MENKIVINCALPYANSTLHIGNIAGCYLGGDIFNRFCRLYGKDTIFISGSDEYGTPTTIRAEKENKTPKEIVDFYHEEQKKVFAALDIQFDYFGRTTSEMHTKFVQEVYSVIKKKGYIEEMAMISPYCPTCKKFLPDRYVIGICPRCGNPTARGDQCEECGRNNDPQDLIEPKCAISGDTPEFKETKHMFLLLDKFQNFLKDWIESQSSWRSNVKAFSLGFIDSGLKPRAITRDIEWGVAVPEKGYENKRFYVWFEALLGYISNAQEFSIQSGREKLWFDYYHSGKSYYFMGKDNIFFHTIMLPSILQAYGNGIELPTEIIGNEYLRFTGKKFSKSKGIGYNANEILQMVDKDSLRYYLSSILPETSDSDFTLQEMVGKVNGELADKYGNYANRVLAFCIKKNILPENKGEHDTNDSEALNTAASVFSEYSGLMEHLEFRKALSKWLELVSFSNTYFNTSQPWKLVVSDQEKCKTKLYISLKLLDYCTVMLSPFVPSGTSRIWSSYHREAMDKNAILNLTEKVDYDIRSSEIPFRKLELPEEPKNNLNLTVGKITEAGLHPNADGLLLLKVSLGYKGIKLVAGLRKYYDPSTLVGRKIIVVENLKWAKIRGEESQGMLLAAQDSKGAHIITTDEPEGTPVKIGDHEYNGEQKIEIDDLKAYDLRVDIKDGKSEITGIIGRDRLTLSVNGKSLLIDGGAQDKSTVR